MNENENTIPDSTEEIPENTTPTDSTPENMAERLSAAETGLALLCCGIAKEHLEEAAKLAKGLCAAGKSPEEAAKEVSENYPHLRTVSQQIPQFSAAGSGSCDGFAAIRRIFSGR